MLPPKIHLGGTYCPPVIFACLVSLWTLDNVSSFVNIFPSLQQFLYIIVQSYLSRLCVCCTYCTYKSTWQQVPLLPGTPTVPLYLRLEVFYPVTRTRLRWLCGPTVHFNPPIGFFYPRTCLVECFYPSNPQSQSRHLQSLCIVLLVHAYFMHS